jgi:hypothetical protein
MSSRRLNRARVCAAAHSPTGRSSLRILPSSHAIHRTFRRVSMVKMKGDSLCRSLYNPNED